MGIAISLREYLDGQGIPYDALSHRRTGCAARSAAASHIPIGSMAKAVVLCSGSGYLLAVVPASRQVNLDQVGRCAEQPVTLATEDEFIPLFPDCERGAVPPIGSAYGLRTIVDDSLEDRDDIYFEAGDHRTLVHITRENFHQLMRTVDHGKISLDVTRRDDDPAYFGA